MEAKEDFTLGLDQRFVSEGSDEHFALSAAFVIAYMALAAIGRDVFFNHLADTDTSNDIIGYYLPYVRVATCAFAIAVVVASSGLTWALSKVPLMFAPFCLWTLLSVAWVGDPKDTLRGAFTLIAAWAAMPMIIHRLGAVHAARLSIYLVAWVCIASFLLAILLPRIGRHDAADLLQAGHAGQWRGIFAHKNGLGPWAAYGSVLLLFYGRFLGANAFFRWTSWACACACLIFSGSFTSLILAVFCAIIFVFLYALRRLPLSWVLAGAIGAAICGAVVAYAASALIFVATGRDLTFSGRADIWKFALDYILARPWTGYGYGSLGGAEFLAREQMVFLQAIPGPESGYVDLVLESGIIGALLFFVPFFAAIRNGFEWMKYVQFEDRQAIEIYVMIMISTLIEAFSETNSLVSTGYDGVLCFGAFFSMLAAPKSPKSIYRKEFRLAKYWLRDAPS